MCRTDMLERCKTPGTGRHPLLPLPFCIRTRGDSRSSPKMPSVRSCGRCCQFVAAASSVFPILLLLLIAFIRPVCSSGSLGEFQNANRTLPLQRRKSMARAHLESLNKPAVKTIQSPDGDIIDCVQSHQQPAFDHPLLKGQKPLDPPERPKGHRRAGSTGETFQSWAMSGETCPEGTVPIRRTTEEDVMRASSVKMFGRKVKRRVRRDSSSDGHEV